MKNILIVITSFCIFFGIGIIILTLKENSGLKDYYYVNYSNSEKGIEKKTEYINKYIENVKQQMALCFVPLALKNDIEKGKKECYNYDIEVSEGKIKKDTDNLISKNLEKNNMKMILKNFKMKIFLEEGNMNPNILFEINQNKNTTKDKIIIECLNTKNKCEKK